MEKVVNALTSLDFFPKIPDDIKVRASSGGAVTIVVGILMAFLMISELIAYSTVQVTSEVGVDTSFGVKLPINFDINMPLLGCNDFGLDFVDHAGDQQLEVEDTIHKTPLPGEMGCNVKGFLLTNKVAGEFHIAFGRVPIATDNQAQSHSHRFTMRELDIFNPSHVINKLAFGKEVPGIENALDGTSKMVTKDSAQYQYYIKVVPTTYHHLDGTTTLTNQYSFTLKYYYVNTHASSFKQPGVYFKYDIAPYRVTYREKRQYFSHFITQLCAILGGLFGVAGMISSGILRANKVVRREESPLPDKNTRRR